MNITCGLMISQDRNLIRLIGAMLRIRTALYSNLYRPNRLDQHGNNNKEIPHKNNIPPLIFINI